MGTAAPGPLNVTSNTAVGGSRTMEIIGFPTDTDPVSGGSRLQVIGEDIGPGLLGHSQNAFSEGGRSKVTWDANGSGLGELDLTGGGPDDAIKILVNNIAIPSGAQVVVEPGQANLTMTVESDAHGSASITVEDIQPGDVILVYSDFTGFSSDIFENVDRVALEIEAGTAADVLIDLLETADTLPPIPEPGSGLLFGLAASGLAVLRRNVRKPVIV